MISGKRRINVDVPLIVAAGLLTAYGLAMVFSAGHTDVRTAATGAWKAQIIWTVVGIGAAFIGPVLATTLLAWSAPALLYVALGLIGVACVPLARVAGPPPAYRQDRHR